MSCSITHIQLICWHCGKAKKSIVNQSGRHNHTHIYTFINKYIYMQTEIHIHINAYFLFNHTYTADCLALWES